MEKLILTEGKSLIGIFLAIASSFGGLSVIFGAFAAHALKTVLTTEALEIWQTGTKYQMNHALALILVALLIPRFPDSLLLRWAGFAFIVGILLFSGSLYGLALTEIRWLGVITPIGGLSLIIGWLCLGLAGWKIK